METLDLSEVVDKNFFEEAKNQPDFNPRFLNNTSSLSLDEVRQTQEVSNNPVVQKYLSALLLTKLEKDGPKGKGYHTVLNNGLKLLDNAQEYKDAIVDSCDSILISEVNEAGDESDVIDWCSHGAEITKKSGKELSGMTLGYINFVTMMWKKITEVSASPTQTGASFIEILKNLKLAQDTLKFQNLEALNMATMNFATSFIENENNLDGSGNDNSKRNIQEAHKILDLLETLKYDDDTYLNEIQNLRNLCSAIEAKKVEVEAPLNIQPSNYDLHSGAQDFSVIPEDEIYIIDSSVIKKMDPPLYAIRSTYFQVCIYRAIYNGAEVAVKMYQAVHPQADWNKIYKEIRIYQRLSAMANNSNCFLKYYGTYVDQSSINMVMEYYPDNLMKYLTHLQTQNYVFNDMIIAPIFYKLASSFATMKDAGIYHSDIKPHNFLVDQYWNIKIIDFSISMVKNEDMTTLATGNFPLQGTDGYMSPELEEAKVNKSAVTRYNPEKSDVFSLGLVFLQMLTYQSVKGFNTSDKNRELQEKVKKIPFPWAMSLIMKMLDANPANRPTFTQLLAFIPTALTTTLNRTQ
jgi:hypothetical protein